MIQWDALLRPDSPLRLLSSQGYVWALQQQDPSKPYAPSNPLVTVAKGDECLEGGSYVTVRINVSAWGFGEGSGAREGKDGECLEGGSYVGDLGL